MRLAFVLALLAGCVPSVVSPPPDEPWVPDAGPATCEGYCERAALLGCSWAEPTPAGESCGAVCENVQSSGVVELDLACRAAATTCEEQDGCER